MMTNSKYIFTDEEQVAKLQLEIKELENQIAELTDERDSLLEIINTKNILKLIVKLPCNDINYLIIYQSYKLLSDNLLFPWNCLYDFINNSSLTEKQVKGIIDTEKNNYIDAEMFCRINDLLKVKKLSISLRCVTPNCCYKNLYLCGNFNMCNQKCIGVIYDNRL